MTARMLFVAISLLPWEPTGLPNQRATPKTVHDAASYLITEVGKRHLRVWRLRGQPVGDCPPFLTSAAAVFLWLTHVVYLCAMTQ
jgi:hypothetical protein